MKDITKNALEQDGFKNYAHDDTIIIYGQAQGNQTVYSNYNQNKVPLIHAAYIEFPNS